MKISRRFFTFLMLLIFLQSAFVSAKSFGESFFNSSTKQTQNIILSSGANLPPIILETETKDSHSICKATRRFDYSQTTPSAAIVSSINLFQNTVFLKFNTFVIQTVSKYLKIAITNATLF